MSSPVRSNEIRHRGDAEGQQVANACRIPAMVRATLYMTVKEGRGPDFERAWRAIAEQVRAVSGNVRQTLARDPEDSDSFVVTSDWSSREVFGEFERSPEQDELTAPLRELRSSARMTVHEILIDIEGGAGGRTPPSRDPLLHNRDGGAS
jgi:heme-degrading monooxygenase HmoA